MWLGFTVSTFQPSQIDKTITSRQLELINRRNYYVGRPKTKVMTY